MKIWETAIAPRSAAQSILLCWVTLGNEVFCSVVRFFFTKQKETFSQRALCCCHYLKQSLLCTYAILYFSLFQASKSQLNCCKWNSIDWKPRNIQKKWVWFCDKWRWWVCVRITGSKEVLWLHSHSYPRIPLGRNMKIIYYCIEFFFLFFFFKDLSFCGGFALFNRRL